VLEKGNEGVGERGYYFYGASINVFRQTGAGAARRARRSASSWSSAWPSRQS